MPRPVPPPTPGSSSDLRGKEGASTTPTFNLPPTAFQENERASTASATPSANGSDSSYRPISPPSPADSFRKRPASQSGPTITNDDFTLPPPPTRSRKIIQMKPKESEQEAEQALHPATPAPAKAASNAQPSGKKGRNSSHTTAAGRKIARKTAHSLIERRRRSKMNEEFGVLKDMIPACKGQEMHKLAILQASIDYLRYLERCVADLKAQNSSSKAQQPPVSRKSMPDEAGEDDDDDDEDEEMEYDDEGETAVSTLATAPRNGSSSIISLPSLSEITTTTTSPSAFSTARHYSVSSTSQASYSPYFHSNQTSPAFGPQLSQISTASSVSGVYNTSRDHIGLGSPAIKPLDSSLHSRPGGESVSELSDKRQRTSKSRRSELELDQEATAALLMLNHHDRRNWRANPESEGGRSGMSVRDLLSG